MFYFLIILLVSMDQGIKWLIDKNFMPRESLPVIDGIFHLTYIRNTGAGFGLFAGKQRFLIIITIIILISLIIYRYKNGKSLLRDAALVFLFAGALGNLLDRVRLSYVIDYLDFRVWPVFNLADILINIGAGLLIISIWKSEGDTYEGE